MSTCKVSSLLFLFVSSLVLPSLLNSTIYSVDYYSNYYYNTSDSKGNPHHLCMLTYYIPTGFQPYTLPHDNSKSCKPFYLTWPSTLELIKKEGSTSGPKQIVARVCEKVGSVMGASAPGQLPHGERQVSSMRRHLQFSGKDGGSDELFVMMQKAKTEDPFIRNINAVPDPTVIALQIGSWTTLYGFVLLFLA